MRKNSRQSQDLQSQRSSQSNNSSSIRNVQDQYSQSFAVGSISKKFVNVTLPNIEIKGKQHYKKQPYCTICFRNFSTTFRQHHCRICVNAVCSECSRSMINKERACDVCILRFTNIHEEKKKKEMLETLETLCAFLIYQKNQKLSELQKLKCPNGRAQEQIQGQLQQQELTISQLQKQNQKMKTQYQLLEQKLNKVREQNCQLQAKNAQLERQMQGTGVQLNMDDILSDSNEDTIKGSSK